MSAPLRREKPLGKIVFETLEKKTETSLNIFGGHRKAVSSYIDSNNFNFAVCIICFYGVEGREPDTYRHGF